MCTVTIIPKGDYDFILTSNRDEAPNRISITPEFYTNSETKLLYPKDELSGGTWVGISDKKRVVCVLNGGFLRHERKQNYRLSRGIVALDFMVGNSIIDMVETYNLTDIEPFTMIIVDWNSILGFYELVWDGVRKHFKRLPLEPKIWSSSTLYTDKMRQDRLLWFTLYKMENKLSASSVLDFHKTAGNGNEDYGVIMNRGFVKTTSITQISKDKKAVTMYHENLQNKLVSSKLFHISETING